MTDLYLPILTTIFAAVIVCFTLYSVKRGIPTPSPTKTAIAVIGLSIIGGAAFYATGAADLWGTVKAVTHLVAAAIFFAAAVLVICASIGLFRFGDEYGINIFYVRNHITGVIDDVCALTMIFVGILIGRLDLAAVGFFFFAFIPFVGNALANAYYYTVNKKRGVE